MSSNAGCRICGNIWSAASPFFGGRARRTIPLHTNYTILTNVIQVGWSGLTLRQFGPPPGLCRLIGIRGFASRSYMAFGEARGTSNTAAMERCTSAYASKIKSNFISKTTTLDRRKVPRVVNVSSQRQIHNRSRRTRHGEGKRNKSSISSERTTTKSAEEPARHETTSHTSNTPQRSVKDAATLLGNKHLIDRLPNMPNIHRPSKEELLAAATGFWSRLKVRFKWFSIRSMRPFNADEIGAFFSWFVLGHVLWIILGTTTFVSLAIFAVNTVFAQGKISIY